MLSAASLNSWAAKPKMRFRMIAFLVHGYYEVDADEVWNVVEKDLLPLKQQLESYLKEF